MSSEKQTRILLFTGDGKGKTTAAAGMALRAAGHGMRSLIIQFVKNDEKTGEIAACAKIPEIEIMQTGMGFVPDRESPLFMDHKKGAERGLEIAARALSSGDYGVVVLDEICVAVSKELLDEQDVLRVIKDAKSGCVIVLTGRNAAQGLLEAADTVTEMKCLKHGYKRGVKAQMGVEF